MKFTLDFEEARRRRLNLPKTPVTEAHTLNKGQDIPLPPVTETPTPNIELPNLPRAKTTQAKRNPFPAKDLPTIKGDLANIGKGIEAIGTGLTHPFMSALEQGADKSDIRQMEKLKKQGQTTIWDKDLQKKIPIDEAINKTQQRLDTGKNKDLGQRVLDHGQLRSFTGGGDLTGLEKVGANVGNIGGNVMAYQMIGSVIPGMGTVPYLNSMPKMVQGAIQSGMIGGAREGIENIASGESLKDTAFNTAKGSIYFAGGSIASDIATMQLGKFIAPHLLGQANNKAAMMAVQSALKAVEGTTFALAGQILTLPIEIAQGNDINLKDMGQKALSAAIFRVVMSIGQKYNPQDYILKNSAKSDWQEDPTKSGHGVIKKEELLKNGWIEETPGIFKGETIPGSGIWDKQYIQMTVVDGVEVPVFKVARMSKSQQKDFVKQVVKAVETDIKNSGNDKILQLSGEAQQNAPTPSNLPQTIQPNAKPLPKDLLPIIAPKSDRLQIDPMKIKPPQQELLPQVQPKLEDNIPQPQNIRGISQDKEGYYKRVKIDPNEIGQVTVRGNTPEQVLAKVEDLKQQHKFKTAKTGEEIKSYIKEIAADGIPLLNDTQKAIVELVDDNLLFTKKNNGFKVVFADKTDLTDKDYESIYKEWGIKKEDVLSGRGDIIVDAFTKGNVITLIKGNADGNTLLHELEHLVDKTDGPRQKAGYYIVKNALENGKKIPKEIINQYPELKPQNAPLQPQTIQEDKLPPKDTKDYTDIGTDIYIPPTNTGKYKVVAYRGYNPQYEGQQTDSTAMFGEGKYYSNTKSVAEHYAQSRGEGGKVEENEILIEKPFNNSRLDTTTQEYKKLEQLINADGRLNLERMMENFTPFDVVKKAFNDPNLKSYINTEQMTKKANEAIRKAGYDAIVSEGKGYGEYSDFVEIVSLNPIKQPQPQKAPITADTFKEDKLPQEDIKKPIDAQYESLDTKDITIDSLPSEQKAKLDELIQRAKDKGHKSAEISVNKDGALLLQVQSGTSKNKLNLMVLKDGNSTTGKFGTDFKPLQSIDLTNTPSIPKEEIKPIEKVKTMANTDGIGLTKEQKAIKKLFEDTGEDINKTITDFKDKIKALEDEEFNYLKASAKKGVEQGGIYKDADGNVVGRHGRISKNEEWYRDLYKELGRTPTDADLRRLAQKRISEGFDIEGQRIEANETYNHLLKSLTDLEAVKLDSEELTASLDIDLTPVKEKRLREKLEALKVKHKEIVTKLKEDFKERTSQLKEQQQTKIQEIKKTNDVKSLWQRLLAKEDIKNIKLKHKEDISKIRQSKADAIEKLKQRFRDKETRQKQRAYIQKLKEDIQKKLQKQLDVESKIEQKDRKKLLSSMQDMKKLSKEMPPAYKKAARELLKQIDIKALSMTAKTKLRLEKTMAFFDDKKANDPDYIVDERLINKLSRLHQKSIKEMTIDDVRLMQKAVDHILFMAQTEKKLFSQGKAIEKSEFSNAILVEAKPKIKHKGPDKDGVMDWTDKDNDPIQRENLLQRAFNLAVDVDPLRPKTMALKILNNNKKSLAYKLLYEDPTKGIGKQLKFEQDIEKLKEEHTKGIDISKMTGKKAVKYEMTTKDGNKLRLNSGQRIALYMHSLNNENFVEMSELGISPFQGSAKVKFAREDIKKLEESLTKEELKVIDRAKAIFHDRLGKAINETSMQILGYEIAEQENYFPKPVDQAFLEKIPTDGDYKISLEGMSFLKERVGNGKPLILEDYFEVEQRHIKQVAAYYGLAVPVRNLKEVMIKNPEVRQAVKQAYGLSTYRYIEDYIKDLDGDVKHYNNFERLMDKGLISSQAGIVGANLNIILSQSTSYPAALQYLQPQHLIAGITDRVNVEEMTEISEFIWHRTRGYVNREAGEISKLSEVNKNTFTKALDLTRKPITAVDIQTIGKLYNAAKRQTKAQNKDLDPNSEEFKAKLKDLIENIIFDTQPNSTLSQRSAIGRSKSIALRAVTPFSTASAQLYNMGYESYLDLKHGNKEGAARKIAGLIASILAISSMGYGIDKYRKNDANFGEQLRRRAVGTVYFANNIYEMLVKGEVRSNLVTQSFGEALTSLGKVFTSKSGKVGGRAWKSIMSISQMFGVPLKNANREVETLLKHYDMSLYYDYKSSMQNVSDSQVYADLWKAIEKDNIRDARAITKALHSRGKKVTNITQSGKSRDLDIDSIRKAVEEYRKH